VTRSRGCPRRRRGRIGLALLSILAACSQGVGVDEPWVRLPPPGANAAGYLTLRNHDSQPRTLMGASSACCERVEFHRSVIQDGRARMLHEATLEIPARGSLEFAPRGLHLMLIRPGALALGDVVEIALELDSGETLSVGAPVRSGGDAPSGPQPR
jgi:hypothetical protein